MNKTDSEYEIIDRFWIQQLLEQLNINVQLSVLLRNDLCYYYI
jgi:hypothetical protein